MVTDQQVRKLMDELNHHGQIGRAALRSGIDRKTARKYRDTGKLPSELKIKSRGVVYEQPRRSRGVKEPSGPE